MKKIAILLVLLLLVSVPFTLAQDNGEENDEDEIEVSEDDTQVGDELAGAQEPAPVLVRQAISRLHLVGNGIAVSENDPFDFLHARAVVGAVKVMATEDDNIDSEYVAKRLGVLMLDEQRYHLKDIAVSMDEISAEIYALGTSGQESETAVGEILVKRFEKPGRDIWAGNMVVSGKAYNVYFLGVGRAFRLAERARKIGEYCEENPDDSRCQRVLPECISEPEQCRERVRAYCEGNPQNLGCLQLKKLYCLNNASDERCRDYLTGLCERYPRLGFCDVSTVNGEQVIAINAGEVKEATIEAGETIREMVSSKIRARIRAITQNLVDEADSWRNRGD